MKNKKTLDEIESLKTELAGLKIRIRRIEDFLNDLPNTNDYLNIEEHASEPDELYDEAVELVKEWGKASASLIQRKLKIGYARAARIIDQLEKNKVISPAQGIKPRTVFEDSESGE